MDGQSAPEQPSGAPLADETVFIVVRMHDPVTNSFNPLDVLIMAISLRHVIFPHRDLDINGRITSALIESEEMNTRQI